MRCELAKVSLEDQRMLVPRLQGDQPPLALSKRWVVGGINAHIDLEAALSHLDDAAKVRIDSEPAAGAHCAAAVNRTAGTDGHFRQRVLKLHRYYTLIVEPDRHATCTRPPRRDAGSYYASNGAVELGLACELSQRHHATTGVCSAGEDLSCLFCAHGLQRRDLPGRLLHVAPCCSSGLWHHVDAPCRQNAFVCGMAASLCTGGMRAYGVSATQCAGAVNLDCSLTPPPLAPSATVGCKRNIFLDVYAARTSRTTSACHQPTHGSRSMHRSSVLTGATP